VYDAKNIQCWRFGAEPKVCVTIASLEPVPSIPQTQTEASGIEASGKAEFVNPGTDDADVVNVKIPDDETLYSVTEAPLKLNEKGIVWLLDHVGVVTPSKIVVQFDDNPLPKGYSPSVFKPPGFCPGDSSGI